MQKSGYDFNEIKARISCKEYAERELMLKLESDGPDSWRSRSFRPDSENNTVFHISNNLWSDFATGTGGDVIDLCAAAHHNGDRIAAVRELMKLCGMSFTGTGEKEWRRREKESEELQGLIEYWHTLLTSQDRAYLHGRGINDKTIDALKIGRGDGRSTKYGNHTGRLICPYWHHERVVYFASRAMDDPNITKDNPKYQKAFIGSNRDLEHCVWGLDTLGRHTTAPLIIAEGMFDAMSFYQEGYRIISPITGRFSHEQITDARDAARMCGRVVMVFDNDTSGASFRVDMAEHLWRANVKFSTARIPEMYNGEKIKDVSDFYQRGGKLLELIRDPNPESTEAGGSDPFDRQSGLVYLARIKSAWGSNITDAVRDKGSAQKRTDLIGSETVSGKSVSLDDAKTALRGLLRTAYRFMPSEIKKFEMSIKREIAANITEDKWIGELLKQVQKRPQESEITEWVLKRHTLMFLPNRGIYEYTAGHWKFRDDSVINSYINQESGRFKTASLIANTLKILKSEPSVVRSDLRLNEQPIMCFRNGVLDLASGTLRQHSPMFYSSIMVPYDYTPEANCPRWKQFLYEVTGGDTERMTFLQEMAGYILFHDNRLGKAFILKGEGANGKSVFLEVLAEVFGGAKGENISNVEISGFDKDFQLVRLDGSILNISTEMKATLDTAMDIFKQVVTGDTVQACRKFQSYYSFIPRTKLIFAGNDFFKSKDTSYGFIRRLCFVTFPIEFGTEGKNMPTRKELEAMSSAERRLALTGTFKADPELKNKLLQELSGIFNWLYDGYKKLIVRGSFTETEDHRETIREFKLFTQPVRAFVEDKRDTLKSERSRRQMYIEYKAWCEDNNHKAASAARFIRDFRRALMDAKIPFVEYNRHSDRGYSFN